MARDAAGVLAESTGAMYHRRGARIEVRGAAIVELWRSGSLHVR
ncbi:hypothetical protein [Streptomyces sp. NBC_00887]|nr:hypothetical protein OG844_00430 [Streptomyces sp. NBC_00887]WSY36331.1 hypothetical protein OG844_45165 [Streptomyces sp. NBC_00887]